MGVLKTEFDNIKKAMMTGVGYMIPFVVFGGILIALTIAFSGIVPEGRNCNNKSDIEQTK